MRRKLLPKYHVNKNSHNKRITTSKSRQELHVSQSSSMNVLHALEKIGLGSQMIHFFLFSKTKLFNVHLKRRQKLEVF